MGTWGIGNLENDAAADWIADLVESNDFSLIEKSLKRVTGGDGLIAKLTGNGPPKYIDANIASDALAAAEIIAALHGKPSEALPERAIEFVSKFSGRETTKLAALAQQAIERISKDSELVELWEEAGDLETWNHELSSTKARLQPR